MLKRESIATQSRRRRRPGSERPVWLTPDLVDLFDAIASLADADEALRVLRDLCTIQELETLAMRWQVARLVDQGVHYGEISKRTGASTATISRVSTWLRYGMGGYRLLLGRKPR